MKVLFTFLHLSSPNLIENDHNFVFFDYKVSTQQHFESRLFWKKCREAENSRITEVLCLYIKLRKTTFFGSEFVYIFKTFEYKSLFFQKHAEFILEIAALFCSPILQPYFAVDFEGVVVNGDHFIKLNKCVCKNLIAKM